VSVNAVALFVVVVANVRSIEIRGTITDGGGTLATVLQ
jgi:hypothetical protein